MHISFNMRFNMRHSSQFVVDDLTRRAVCGALTVSVSLLGPAATPARDASLFDRLDATVLKQLPTAPKPEIPVLPSWVAGRWRCEQTLQRFTTPLGVQFIGAAGQPVAEAEKSAAETRAQVGKPVQLELRFAALEGGGAVEERRFNAQSRIDAFAGRKVVREVQPCAVTPGADILAARPAACTLVEFRGPVTQKQLVTSVQQAETPDGRSLCISEQSRIILSRRAMQGDTRSFPPITTDQETLLEIAHDGGADTLRGRLRLVSFLQPLDPLYFEANKRSVSISDYSLLLQRLPPEEPS